jgi:signal transduction histidine kinase
VRKAAIVFILAILAPSLALGWLAARSLRNQQLVVERQETLLCQAAADAVAQAVVTQIRDEQAGFAAAVENLLAGTEPRQLGYPFDAQLRTNWALAQIGFSVALNGEVMSPLPWGGQEARNFRLENDRFLCSRETVEVVWQSPKGKIVLNKPDEKKAGEDKSVFATKGGVPVDESNAGGSAQFRQIVGDSREGTLGRFLQDQLVLLFWYRSPRDTNMVFGAQIKVPQLVEKLRPAVHLEPPLSDTFVVALRDDGGRVAAISRPDFTADWKRPFLSTEVGEILPHWEVALYLIDPMRLRQAANTIQWTIGLLIVILLVAIVVGSLLLAHDLRREMVEARQKTDFVSNVSHELKTPLTSIRMFSEMLAEGRNNDPAAQQRFAKIISSEAARLTRLINNVLEFARRDRGEAKYHFTECDLRELTHSIVETYRPTLLSHGFTVTTELPEPPLLVHGDPDALSQILLNLLSNAEKYWTQQKEIDVQLRRAGERIELTVCDRGPGVPAGFEEKIFEKFVRAHDSLASGIPGTGLGLTLARQIARTHGGDICYAPRVGGGSCFTFHVPAA